MEKKDKVTKKMVCEVLEAYFTDNEININGITSKDIVNYAVNEQGILARKNSKANEKKNTEDIVICDMIKEELAKINKPVTVGELMAQSEIIKNFVKEDGTPLTSPKITAMIRKMVDKDEIIKTQDKKKTYYSVV